MRVITLKAKGTDISTSCVLVDKVVIPSIRVNNPETTIHSYWYWKISKRTADNEARFLTVGVITNEKKWLE